MCIAILNKPNITLSKETLKNCWEKNKDGGGLLYAVGGVLHTYKTLSKKKLIKEYMAVREANPTIAIVLHFRWSTHGFNNLANTHPHLVGERLGFVHNGIIDNVVDDHTIKREFWSVKEGKMLTGKSFNSVHSDSALFAKMLAKLPEGFLQNEVFVELIEKYIDDDNKLIFLDNLGVHTIVNESKGVWDSGCWFSNLGYLSKKDLDEKEAKEKMTQARYHYWGQDEVVSPKESKPYEQKFKWDDEKDEDDDIMGHQDWNRESSMSVKTAVEGCCSRKTYTQEEGVDTCEYCAKALETRLEIVNNTCNQCYEYFLTNGGYGGDA